MSVPTKGTGKDEHHGRRAEVDIQTNFENNLISLNPTATNFVPSTSTTKSTSPDLLNAQISRRSLKDSTSPQTPHPPTTLVPDVPTLEDLQGRLARQNGRAHGPSMEQRLENLRTRKTEMQRLRLILAAKIERLKEDLNKDHEDAETRSSNDNEQDKLKGLLIYLVDLRERLLDQGAALLPQIQEVEHEIITWHLDE